MSIDMNYFMKIQNSKGLNSKTEKQVYDIKKRETKNFNSTYGTREVTIISNDYDESNKLIERTQDIILIKQSNINIKKIIAKPNETFKLGEIIKVFNTRYMIVEIDANETIHTVGKAQRCNVCLKWQDKKGNIVYSYGILTNNQSLGVDEKKVITTVDSTNNIWLPLNDSTVILKRDKRFAVELFDINEDGEENERDSHFRELMLENDCEFNIYKITKRNSIEKTYDGYGYLSFSFSEVVYNPNTDRIDLWLCDYKEPKEEPIVPPEPISNKVSKITYSGEAVVKSGIKSKKYYAKFYDGDVEVDLSTIDYKWEIDSTFDSNLLIHSEENGYIVFNFDEDKLIDEKFKLRLVDNNGEYENSEVVISIMSCF